MQRTIEALSRDDSIDRLHRASVGRLLYADADGPAAMLVNYALADGGVIIRVDSGTKASALGQSLVGFEVDHVDDTTHAAWNVLVRGMATEVDIDAVPELLHQMHGTFPHPWATGVHNVWIKITPTKITGRRLGASAVDAVF